LEKDETYPLDEVENHNAKSVKEILIEELKKPLLVNREMKDYINNINEYRNIKVI
jgi:hypothetical protein